MGITCPEYKNRSYKKLVDVHGESFATLLWNEFNGNVPVDYFSLQSNENILNQNVDKNFDDNLLVKLKNKLQRLYPEIKLTITNNPAWLKGRNVFDQKSELDKEVQYRLKSIEILLSDKAKQVFAKGNKNNWSLDKILTELAIPKAQKALLLDLGIDTKVNAEVKQGVSELFETNPELANIGTVEQYSNYLDTIFPDSKVKDIVYHGTNIKFDSFDLAFEGSNEKGGRGKGFNFTRDLEDTDLYGDIKIAVLLNAVNKVETDNKAKEIALSFIDDIDEVVVYDNKQIHILGSKQDVQGFKDFVGKPDLREQLALELASKYAFSVEINTAKENSKLPQQPHPMDGEKSFTVNGDKYSLISDVEFDEDGATNITKAFKNNVEISIDEYLKGKKLAEDAGINTSHHSNLTVPGGTNYTERAIKLLGIKLKQGSEGVYHEDQFNNNEGDMLAWSRQDELATDTSIVRIKEIQSRLQKHRGEAKLTEGSEVENNMLQLFAKDDNWVTFVIKSLVQQAAKEGKSKIRFPKGETAAKIEGHETLAIELTKINNELEQLQKIDLTEKGIVEGTSIKNKIATLELRKQDLKSQGIEKLKPIEAFYEIKVGNILEKQFGKDNVKTITDEFGNQWREITIDQARDLQDILLQKNEADEIIGQANIRARTVLVDAVSQKQDTLPHEYAHHYIAWFRDSAIVQEAIKKWGSEEKLVQSIGEQSVKQKGEAWEWWNKFIKWILGDLRKLSKLDKDSLTKILTDAFLQRIDLDRLIKESKPTGIENPIVPLNKEIKRYKLDKNQISSKSKIIIEKNDDGIGDHYIAGFEEGSNRRVIANRFFRLINKNGSITAPYYPFSIDDRLLKLHGEYANAINSYYDRSVVYVNQATNAIEFTTQVNDAVFVGNFNQDKSADLEVDESQLDEPDEVVVDQSKIKAIDEKITDISGRKKLLEARVSKTGGNPTMKAHIKYLESQIEELKKSKLEVVAPDVLEKMAIQDSVLIQKRLQTISENVDNIDNLSAGQILSLMDNLVYVGQNIKTWVDVQYFVEQENIDLKNQLKEVGGTYSQLNHDYQKLAKALFVAYTKQNTQHSKFSKADLEKPVEDVDFATSQFLELGRSGMELLQILDDVIDKAAYDANEQMITKRNEVANWQRRLEKAGFKTKQVVELFKQLHNGNWTGNIVGKVNHSYYIRKQELLNEAKERNSYGKYNKWILENSMTLSGMNLNGIEKSKQTIIDELLAKGYTKEELDNQKRLLDQFREDQVEYSKMLEHKYGDDKNSIMEEMRSWIYYNSPGFAYKKNSVGYKYLIGEKPNKNWHDERFSAIESNPELMAFYDFIKQRFDENNKHLGYFNQFDEFYLPEKKSTFWDRIKDNTGKIKKMQLIKNEAIDLIAEEIVDEEFIGVNIAGKKYKSIPIYMMGNKIPASMKDGNIFDVLNAHTDMTLNHKYMSKIEPMANIATDLLDSMQEMSKSGKKSRDGFVNAKKLIEFAKDANFYGAKKNKNELKIKDVKDKVYKYNEETGEMDPVMVLNEETGEMEHEVEVYRQVGFGRMIKTLIFWTYYKTMSLPNVITPSVNLVMGINSNLMYASAGKDVDQKNMHKALLHMSVVSLRSHGAEQNPELVTKVFAFMDKFEIIDAIHDSNYGGGKSVLDKIAILQEKTEYYNQGSLMLGILYHTKLKSRNGKEVSVFDAYKVIDGELVWDIELMGEQSEVQQDRIISEDNKGVDLFRLSNKINEINHEIHGDYKNTIMIKKSALMQAVMMYKSWIPEAVNHRFGKSKISYNLEDDSGKLGREIKGRYRSFGGSKTKDNIDVRFIEMTKLMLKGVVTKKAFNQLSEVDRVNMIRNMSEIKRIIAMYLAVMLLKALMMDDDDDAKPAINLAINMLTKTQADLSFFLNPNAMTQFTDNMIPIVSTLKEAQRAVGYTFDLFTGETRFTDGRVKVLVGYGTLIPGGSGAIKMYNLSSRTYNY